MKKVFLFGRFIRILFILSFIFITYAVVDMCIQSGFKFKYILISLVVVVFIVLGLLWIYSLGIAVNYKSNKLKLILGFTKEKKYERELNSISSINIERVLNVGMNFIINYKSGFSEKIYYKFYRISFIESIQFKRLKKQLSKL